MRLFVIFCSVLTVFGCTTPSMERLEGLRIERVVISGDSARLFQTKLEAALVYHGATFEKGGILLEGETHFRHKGDELYLVTIVSSNLSSPTAFRSIVLYPPNEINLNFITERYINATVQTVINDFSEQLKKAPMTAPDSP